MRLVVAAVVLIVGVTALAEPVVKGPEKGALVIVGGGKVGPEILGRMFDLAGKPLGTLPSEPISHNSIGERLQGDGILVGSTSYVSSPAWYRYSPGGKLERTALANHERA